MYDSRISNSLFQLVDQEFSQSERLLFSSGNVEEVCGAVGQVMKSHSLSVKEDRTKLDAKMHFLQLGEISVSRLQYGAGVEIEPGAMKEFFLVQMPLSGRAVIECPHCKVDSTTNLASVLSADDSVSMQWKPNVDQLMIKIPKPLIERTVVGMTGHPLDEAVRFDLGFEWQRSREWKSLLWYLLTYAAQISPAESQNSLILGQLEQLVATCLLSCHSHNYSVDATKSMPAIRPRHVRIAQSYIDAHLSEDITAERLAGVAGVSVRSLYGGFRDFLGISPMQYLRNLRMEKVHLELQGGQAQSVTGVAMKWGFSHMGRFSVEYKNRYGESPSESLRRF
ncbi:AraC family transcriptional regulator [Vibrio nigripulchritudo ATCC 27043]|uniref:AraC family transcriptional regulator n=1 Tax=Vibrio nigripulchritudo TaxID=28173 RepID=UPI00021C17DD|nr:AraC family transcriptional regulator [Vibrio nigripulchritudo]EGU61148.1 AraC family transcriptional regulator [Vibrio nigripulchritudo ATCC 27043]